MEVDNIRKILLIICVFFTSFLMISTVTAVPKVNSNPLLVKINEIEDYKNILDVEVKKMILDVENGGLIDILIQLIKFIINFVEQLISLITQIFGLVN